jgi:hypothetical protein
MSSNDPSASIPSGGAIPEGAPSFAAPVSPVPTQWGSPGLPSPAGQQPPDAPVPPVEWTPAPVAAMPEERVGRGLVFSLGGIVVGVVLTVLLWKLNFVASITSFAMAYAVIWLYTKGAGSAPRKGVGAVIGVIVAGVVISLASVVATDALDYLAVDYPDATLAEKADFVWYNLTLPEVWQAYSTEVAMYVLFAALGTFGLIRQLGRAQRA